MFHPRIIGGLLLLITLLAYLPAVNSDFSVFDDKKYVVENQMVQDGVTWPSVKWAFTSFYFSNWHPLTMVAYMVDYQLFRLNPAGHHLINVLIHSVNASLLFWLLLRLTGGQWASAFVAALFAWHPLHVESVAWISELKDVASTFFGLLSLLAYVHYARVEAGGGGVAMPDTPAEASLPVAGCRLRFYWLAVVFFALSLMFKSMLVTLPCVMLLLDYWPLSRMRRAVRCLVEKLPFFLLAAGASILTYQAQKNSAMSSLSDYSLGMRLENAVTAYAGYLGKTIWPAHLAVIYPLTLNIPWATVITAILVLVCITVIAMVAARPQPWLLIGWLWYLGTLVPVIGLVQVGSQSMADRYTYFPLIGIFLAVTLVIRELGHRCQIPHPLLAVPAVLVLAGCLVRTECQLRYWRDSQTLFTHTLEITANNPLVHLALGDAYRGQQQPERALTEFQEALRLDPSCFQANEAIGKILIGQGKPAEALGYFQKAMQLRPPSAPDHCRVGLALVELSRLAEAKKEFAEAMRMDPDYAPAQFQFGRTLLKLGDGVAALKYFQAALRLEPDNAQMLIYTAHVLAAHEDPRVRNGTKACALAQRAAELMPGNQPVVLDLLAAAYAEAGRFDEAVQTQQQALKLVRAGGLTEDEPAMQHRLELYQNRQPWRESFRAR